VRGIYHEPESKGVMTSHGELMDHIHEHVKDHGAAGAGAEQEELEGGKQSADGESAEHDTGCVLCDHARDGEKALKEAKVTNINQHGYEKHTVNDPRTSASKGGHNAKHPGFASVQKKIASKENLSQKAAGAILASRSRAASSSAHKANPRLARVG
jgi:hypothetical protein